METLLDSDDRQARQFLESLRWPDAKPRCPHCAATGPCYRLTPRANSATRNGLWRCGECRKQFTVTVKTIFDSSKLPLPVWLRAIELLCSRPSGWTVRALQQELGISYRGAWALTDRIRYATTQKPFPKRIQAAVEPLRAVGRACLYPLTPAEAVNCLLQIVPERKHPLALERRVAYLDRKLGR